MTPVEHYTRGCALSIRKSRSRSSCSSRSPPPPEISRYEILFFSSFLLPSWLEWNYTRRVYGVLADNTHVALRTHALLRRYLLSFIIFFPHDARSNAQFTFHVQRSPKATCASGLMTWFIVSNDSRDNRYLAALHHLVMSSQNIGSSWFDPNSVTGPKMDRVFFLFRSLWLLSLWLLWILICRWLYNTLIAIQLFIYQRLDNVNTIRKLERLL